MAVARRRQGFDAASVIGFGEGILGFHREGFHGYCAGYRAGIGWLHGEEGIAGLGMGMHSAIHGEAMTDPMSPIMPRGESTEVDTINMYLESTVRNSTRVSARHPADVSMHGVVGGAVGGSVWVSVMGDVTRGKR